MEKPELSVIYDDMLIPAKTQTVVSKSAVGLRSVTAISDSKISVVVQGPISSVKGGLSKVRLVLASIREILPNAEIILSTWSQEQLGNLDYDVLVKSPLPSPIIYSDLNRKKNNINRQIISTRNGLAKSTRPYVLKLRTDTSLASSKICTVMDLPDLKFSPLRVFYERVTITSLFSRDPFKSQFPLHPSDCVMFGRREDVEKYWNCPLARPSDFIEHLDPKQPWNGDECEGIPSLVPEQYLMLNLMVRNELFKHLPSMLSVRGLIRSEEAMVCNFSLLEAAESGIEFPDHFFALSRDTVYSQTTWSLLEFYFAKRGSPFRVRLILRAIKLYLPRNIARTFVLWFYRIWFAPK